MIKANFSTAIFNEIFRHWCQLLSALIKCKISNVYTCKASAHWENLLWTSTKSVRRLLFTQKRKHFNFWHIFPWNFRNCPEFPTNKRPCKYLSKILKIEQFPKMIIFKVIFCLISLVFVGSEHKQQHTYTHRLSYEDKNNDEFFFRLFRKTLSIRAFFSLAAK